MSRKTAAESPGVAFVGERFRRLREQSGLTLDDVADRLNHEYGACVNKGMLSRYENGVHEPAAGTVFCLARIMGVPVDYLTGQTDRTVLDNPRPGSFGEAYALPVFTRCNPLDGGEPDPDAVEMVPLSWLSEGRSYFGLRVTDASMAPRFFAGDLVVIERTRRLNYERLVLLSVAGQDAFFCRLRRTRCGKMVYPVSTAHESLFYTTHEMKHLPVVQMGTVVQIRRMEINEGSHLVDAPQPSAGK